MTIRSLFAAWPADPEDCCEAALVESGGFGAAVGGAGCDETGA